MSSGGSQDTTTSSMEAPDRPETGLRTGSVVGDTVRVKVASRESPGAVTITRSRWVPTGVAGEVEIVRPEEPVGSLVGGTKAQSAPAGRSVQLNVTVSLVPERSVAVTVAGREPPGDALPALGLIATENSKGGGAPTRKSTSCAGKSGASLDRKYSWSVSSDWSAREASPPIFSLM